MLPLFKDSNQPFQLMQNKWMSELNPVLQNPMTNPSLIKSITLVTGDNVINHKLGRLQQGWIITDVNAAVSIYRSQPLNDLTLTLNSSGAAIINIAVY